MRIEKLVKLKIMIKDILVAKALKKVKELKKEEAAAFRKMSQEMKENNKFLNIKKVD